MVHRYSCYSFVNTNQQLVTVHHFSENFGNAFVPVIRDSDTIPTVAGDGRVAFVGVDDVAKASYDALVIEKNLETEYYVLGPQLYSYDEVSDLTFLNEPTHDTEITGRSPPEQGLGKGNNTQTPLAGRRYH